MGRMVSTKADILCCRKDPALPRPILCACQVCTLKFSLSVKKEEMFRILQIGQFGPTAEVEFLGHLSHSVTYCYGLASVVCRPLTSSSLNYWANLDQNWYEASAGEGDQKM